MNDKSLYTLEFDKIREMLRDRCPTEGAAELAMSLTPSADIVEVEHRQLRTEDAKRLLQHSGMPSFVKVIDIRAITTKAEKSASLNPRELLDVANVLTTSRGLIAYIRGCNAFTTSLDEVFERLLPNKKLEDRIISSIISEEVIADDASPALADIRRKLRRENNRVTELLQHFVSGSSQSKYLQENIITTRGGRFVVPVKSEYRGEVKGLIHDTSSSGATLFIEPMSVVEANNRIRELKSLEEHEIDRILAELSAAVADYSGALNLNYLNITDLAFYFGCADLAVKMDAVRPVIDSGRRYELIKAKHPMLDPNTAVPLTMSLGEDYSMLIITGPNTGGKTVTLKTIGLFALMAQSGLQIPAAEGSRVCVFDEIFSDIGDEQSIEQSLSTFSSHMVGIINIIDEMTEQSLVLFDELGAGTDPVEGAALAMAILEEVRLHGAACTATTHYAELKAYAIETDGVMNASCEFDVETLRPTYRLVIGTPGKSNAFAISEKLGLPQSIVRRATEYVDGGTRSFEAVIDKLNASRQSLESEREKAAEIREHLEKSRIDADAAFEKELAASRKEAKRMEEAARRMLTEARAASEFVFRQLDEVKRQQEKANFANNLFETKRRVKNALRESASQLDPVREKDNEEYTLPRPLVKGDTVIHRALGTSGVLLENPDKNGNVTVQMGIMKSRVNIKDLKLEKEQTGIVAGGKMTAAKDYKASVSRNFRPELDIRGQLGDDGWFITDRYLDEAGVAGVKTVTIIHGKGTGALRNAIWNRLKKDRRVKSYRPGQFGEGDYGVTVVELK